VVRDEVSVEALHQAVAEVPQNGLVLAVHDDLVTCQHKWEVPGFVKAS
jgi:hypothetical protein